MFPHFSIKTTKCETKNQYFSNNAFASDGTRDNNNSKNQEKWSDVIDAYKDQDVQVATNDLTQQKVRQRGSSLMNHQHHQSIRLFPLNKYPILIWSINR